MFQMFNSYLILNNPKHTVFQQKTSLWHFHLHEEDEKYSLWHAQTHLLLQTLVLL